MVWSHYVNETHLPEIHHEDEQWDDSSPQYLDYQDWITMNSDDLYNLWFSIKQYREDMGCSTLLQHMDWNDFCEFVYKFSS